MMISQLGLVFLDLDQFLLFPLLYAKSGVVCKMFQRKGEFLMNGMQEEITRELKIFSNSQFLTLGGQPRDVINAVTNYNIRKSKPIFF